MINGSSKKNLVKWAKWIGIGLLSSLLILSPYFWLGLLLIGFAMLRWIVDESSKAIANGVRAGYKLTKSTVKNKRHSNKYNSNQNLGNQDKNGF